MSVGISLTMTLRMSGLMNGSIFLYGFGGTWSVFFLCLFSPFRFGHSDHARKADAGTVLKKKEEIIDQLWAKPGEHLLCFLSTLT